LGAGASSLIASLLKLDADGMSEQQREDARSLLTSIVGGVAGAVSADVVVSATAAATELTNNALTLSQIKQFSEEAQACSKLNNCDEVRDKYRQISMDQWAEVMSVCAQNTEVCRAKYGQYVVDLNDYWKVLGSLSDLDLPADFKKDLLSYRLQMYDVTRAVALTGFAEQLVKKYNINVTPEEVALIAAAVMGTVGGVKGGPPRLNSLGKPISDASVTISGKAGVLEVGGVKYPLKPNGTGSTFDATVKSAESAAFSILEKLSGGGKVQKGTTRDGHTIFTASDANGNIYTAREFSKTSLETGVPEWTVQGPRAVMPGGVKEIKLRE
jgi:hypothetical protein